MDDHGTGIFGSQLLAADEFDCGIHRHDAARDDAVKVGIGEHGLIGNEDGLNDVFAAQAFGGVVPGVQRGGRLTNGEFHIEDLLKMNLLVK